MTKCLSPLNEWLRENGLSRAQFYTIPPEFRPAVIRIGRKVFVPLDAASRWLESIPNSGIPTNRQSKFPNIAGGELPPSACRASKTKPLNLKIR